MLGAEGEGGEEGVVGGSKLRLSTDRLCDTGGDLLICISSYCWVVWALELYHVHVVRIPGSSDLMACRCHHEACLCDDFNFVYAETYSSSRQVQPEEQNSR